MKLIIVAALIAACAAGRLEHLERSYLPPDSSNSLGHNGFGSNGHGSFGSSAGGSHGSFGSNGGSNGGFGSNGGSHGGFGSNGASHGSSGFGSNGASHGSSGFGSNGASHGSSGFGSTGNGFGSSNGNGFGSSNGNGFGAATSNQYLPPNHGPSASIGVARNGQSSFGIPSTQYGTPAFGSNNGFGSQSPSAQYQRPSGSSSQSQFGLSNQYLTPKQGSNFQNIPQQSFDEQTGYHY